MHRLTFCTRQIPFKDFLLTNQGYVQNEQLALNTGRIRAVGLLLADRLNVRNCMAALVFMLISVLTMLLGVLHNNRVRFPWSLRA